MKSVIGTAFAALAENGFPTVYLIADVESVEALIVLFDEKDRALVVGTKALLACGWQKGADCYLMKFGVSIYEGWKLFCCGICVYTVQ